MGALGMGNFKGEEIFSSGRDLQLSRYRGHRSGSRGRGVEEERET